MTPEARPTPERFLEMIERARRGRLKIYIGHAAGTGKTVQMLREGNDLRTNGKNVLGAYIETHGRKGTVAAVGALPILPRKKIQYKGTTIEEMDLDEVLRLHPEVAIVDELAHSNAPGSRNEKRWQDVDELLDAGINVITAINIQHIESLNAVVERVTGVKVRETVPDSFLASADQIVNLDISSSDLRERIRRGEVYDADKIARALDSFFTAQNLSSLRELALRETVRFLDQSRRDQSAAVILDEKDGNALPSAGIAEADVDPIVMVATSSRPPDIRNLLRKASAIANRLNTHWYLVYVETPRESRDNIDATTQRLLMNNISLAKDLGATVVRLKGTDIAKSLADFAREYGVTHAIFGASSAPVGLGGLIHRFRPDIITRFRNMAPQIDVHICGLR